MKVDANLIVIRNVTYAEIDKAVDRWNESDEWMLLENIMIPVGDDAIFLDGMFWRITDKNLIFAEGVYCNGINGGYESDWSLTMLYKNVSDDEFDPQKYLYYEQDCPTTTIHNYEYYCKG